MRERIRRVMRVVAVVVAWVFALGTLAIVAFTAWSYWPGTTVGRTTSIMSVTDDDGVMHAWIGFLYAGIPGIVLLLTEFLGGDNSATACWWPGPACGSGTGFTSRRSRVVSPGCYRSSWR